MKVLRKIVTIFIFNLLTIICLLITPVFFLFNSDYVKQILVKIEFYQQISTISKQQIKQLYRNEDDLYSQIMNQYYEDIISTQWLTSIGNKIIDSAFVSFKNNQDFNPMIDLSPVKQNYLKHLRRTQIREDISALQNVLPDQISLSTILQMPPESLNFFINWIKNIYKIMQIVYGGVIALLLIDLGFFLIGKSFRQNFSILTINLILLSLIIISLPYVYQYLLLSTDFFQILFIQIPSAWQSLLGAVCLFVLKDILSLWAQISIVILVIALFLLIISQYKLKKL